MKRKKWYDCSSGADEQNFFMSLTRNQKYCWRSTEAIAKTANISMEKTESLLNKFYKMGVVLQHGRDPNLWGYWERVKEEYPDLDVFKTTPSLSQKDKSGRVKKFLGE